MRARGTLTRAIDLSYALVLLTALALLLGSPSRVNAQAQACTAGCGSTENLDPNILDVGDTTEFAPFVTNVSRISVAPFTAVAAELRCVAQDPNSANITSGCCLRLACAADPGITEADCINDTVGGDDGLPGTFSVDMVTLTAAGLTGSAVSTDENTVCVEGTVQLAAGQTNLQLFTVDATAEQPVLSNGGDFFSAFSAPSAVITNTMITSACNNQTTGSCATSATGSVVPECLVEVDKQVSCDGGTTWLDDDGSGTGANEFVTMNEDGTNSPCLGWNAFDGMPAEAVMVRYFARNVGDLDLAECSLTDDNTQIPAATFPNGGSIAVGQVTDPFSPPGTLLCSEPLSAEEPDTATVVSCICPDFDNVEANGGVDPFDTADFECQTPDATFSKNCVDTDVPVDGNDDLISTVAENTGTATLSDCSVTDQLDRGDATTPCANPTETIALDCFDAPPDAAVRNPIAQPFDLAPTDQVWCDNPVPADLVGTACDRATLSCTIDPTGVNKAFTRTSEDLCTVTVCPDVTLDKQVNGGTGFVDIDDLCDPDTELCVAGPDAGEACDPDVPTDCRTIEEAIGWNGEPVAYRYVIDISGAVGTNVECDLVDDILGTINQNPITSSTTIDVPAICGEEISEGIFVEGVNTATLSCICRDEQDMEAGEISDQIDSADLDCRTPVVEITKECALCDPATDTNAIDVTVANAGDADLLDCEVTDAEEQDAGACPSDGLNTSPVTLACFDAAVGGNPVPQPFNLAIGQTVFCRTTVPDTGERCNTATVACEIDDGTGTETPVIDPCIEGTCMVGGGDCTTSAECGSKIEDDTDDDVCEPCVEGCITRTPGFWCTHPTVTDLFLPMDDVCGLALTTVDVNMAGSTTENLIVGNDHKASTSPQLLQLVRQCTAAALNQQASLVSEGDCGGIPVNSSTFDEIFGECCNASFCSTATSGSAISASGCIDELDDFNNSDDTFAEAPPPFDNLGNSMCAVPTGLEDVLDDTCGGQPALCNEANGNGFINPPYRKPLNGNSISGGPKK